MAPSFSKATYDSKRPRSDPPSPAKLQAELEQDARDAAKARELNKDPVSWRTFDEMPRAAAMS